MLPLATSLIQQLFFRTAIPFVVFSYCRSDVVTLRQDHSARKNLQKTVSFVQHTKPN